MTNIAEFYSAQNSSDLSLIERANKALEEIYSTPNGIEELFPILLSKSYSKTIRNSAAVGIKVMLNRFWNLDNIISEETKTSIKHNLVQILSSEDDLNVRHSIIYCIESTLSDESPFPELLELTIGLLSSNVPKQVEIALSLVEILIPYSDEATIQLLLSPLQERLRDSLSTPIDILIISSAKVLAQLCHSLEPPLPGFICEYFKVSFQHLHYFLLSENQSAFSLINAIDSSILYRTIPPEFYVEQTLSILQDNSILHVYPVFTMLSSIIQVMKSSENYDSLLSVIEPISAIAFERGVQAFNIDFQTIEDQEDCDYILSVFDTIIMSCEQNDIFTLYESLHSQLISDVAKPASSYVSLSIMQNFIDEAPETILPTLTNDLQVILSTSINSAIHPSVREKALICLYHIVNTINGGLSEFTESIFSALTTIFQNSASIEIISAALDAQIEVFKTLEYEPFLALPLLPIFQKLLSERTLRISAVNGLALIARTAPEIITDSAISLKNMFSSIITSNESDDDLKSISLEALAYVLSSMNYQSFEDPIFGLFISILQSNNIKLQSATLSSISILVEAYPMRFIQPDILTATIPIILQFLSIQIEAIDPELSNNDGEIEFNMENSESIDAKMASLKYLRSCIKMAKNPENPNIMSFEFGDTIIEALSFQISDQINKYNGIRSTSIPILALAGIARQNNLESLMNILIDPVSDDDPDTVVNTFKAFKTIILSSSIIPINPIKNIFKEALNILRDEKADPDVYHSIARFFDALIRSPSVSSLFDCGTLFKIISIKDRRGRLIHSPLVTTAMTIPIARYYLSQVISGGDSPICFSFLKSQLVFCDGDLPPDPITALNMIIETDIAHFNKYLEIAVSICRSIFQIEDAGQPCIKQTKTSAAALMFSVLKVTGKDSIPFEMLPEILKVIPVRSSKEAIQIYSFLLQPQSLDIFGSSNILAALAKAFAVPPNSLKELKIPNELLKIASKTIMHLFELINDASQIVGAALGEEINANRLRHFLNNYQE